MIEKELKILLSEKQYKTIADLFIWQEEVRQINHYYCDEDSLLNQKNVTIRVRETETSKKLQIKLLIINENAVHINQEYEISVQDIHDKIEMKTLNSLSNENFMKDVYKVGALETLRKKCCWNDGSEICLDLNTYLDTTDYELEIEFTREIDSKILSILENNHIKPRNQTRGKKTRFFEAYNKLNFK